MRKELLKKANMLGLTFAKNITDEALQTLITDAEAKNEVPTDKIAINPDNVKSLLAEIEALKVQLASKEAAAVPSAQVEDNPAWATTLVDAINSNTTQQRRLDAPQKGLDVKVLTNAQELRDKAMTLIRCRIIPRDPVKVSFKGEILTVTNDLLTEVQRYSIPFNIVTHIPYILYKTLVSKKVNIYDESIVSGDKGTGEVTGGFREIDAYSITVLPKLTKEELALLGKKQKLRSNEESEREDAVLELNATRKTEVVDVLKEAGYDL